VTERWAVLGGGIAGLAFAHRALTLRPDLDLTIFEASPRVGGVIRTDRIEGYSCERGPTGVLDDAPATAALAEELGLAARWVTRKESAKLRWIQLGGRLHALPTGPGALLRTKLLSPTGKLRLLCEPLVGRRAVDNPPETVAEFGRRRLGRQAVANLLDPFVTGVFAGNAEELELAACFPKVAKMEAEHGSLFAGMRKSGKHQVLRSFATGMEELVQALHRALEERILLSRPIQRVTRTAKGFALELAGQVPATFEAEQVACCLPAHTAANVLQQITFDLARELEAIPTVDIVSVHLGFRRADATEAMKGFGWLVPSHEGGPILGCLFVSEIFDGRAPEGRASVRFLLGGTRAPAILMMKDEEILATCEASLRSVTGFRGDIVFARVHRIARAIPQYLRGHLDRVSRIEQLLEGIPGLHLTGASYRGVSVNDVIAQARRLAEDGRP
jgi:oxygen-dependent protoporphyrinogen oxidase